MKNKLWFLHTAYWIGILIDAAAAVLLMFPALSAQFFNWTAYQPSAALNSVSGTAAGLMWGWTFLLFWADQKPVERRGVLLLTVCPVLVSLIAVRILEALSGLTSWLPSGLLQPVLVILFSSAYYTARELARR